MTSTVIAVPKHVPIAGVMVYRTVAGAVEVLSNVCVIVDPLPAENPDADPLVKDAVHEYVTVTPVMVVDRPMLVAELWQIVCAVGVAETFGTGSTVTSKLKGVPGQVVGAGPVGVMTYLTTPRLVPVLTRVGLIVAPEPGVEIPVMVPPVGVVVIEADQAKVVPVVADVMV